MIFQDLQDIKKFAGETGDGPRFRNTGAPTPLAPFSVAQDSRVALIQMFDGALSLDSPSEISPFIRKKLRMLISLE